MTRLAGSGVSGVEAVMFGRSDSVSFTDCNEVSVVTTVAKC